MEAKVENKPPPTFEEKTKSLIKEFENSLKDKNFMADGGKLGFPCYHLYTNAQVCTFLLNVYLFV